MGRSAESTARAATVPRPEIVQRRIRLTAQRKQQMARYSERHYGELSWRLRPRGVVQHFTGTDSLRDVVETFRSNAPDPELGERPGACTHFVIDTDGTIYQLASLRFRCRHTVGLNHRMLGVEHVGHSDVQVETNARQWRASLALSAWLVSRLDIGTGDVIGHHESTRSRFHRERYPQWRCQTHDDFHRSTMRRYRSQLRGTVARYAVVTTYPRWKKSRCG